MSEASASRLKQDTQSNQGKGSHGAEIHIEVTWRGTTRKTVTSQDVVTKGRMLFEQRARIQREAGRWGVKFGFGDFRKTKNSWAVVSYRHWGYTMDRWHSLKLNGYLAAVHLILEEELGRTDPECNHPGHGTANHVCHALRILEAVDPIAPSRRKAERMRRPRKPNSVQKTAEVPDSKSVAEPEPAGDEGQPAGDLVEPPKPWSPARPGDLVPDIDDIFRQLPSLRNLSAPSIIHLRQSPEGLDLFIATDIKGDDTFRLYDRRLREFAHAGSSKLDPIRPGHFVNVQTLADLFQKHGLDGISCTDAIQLIGPWKREEFKRNMPDYSKWQEAFHEAFRDEKLANELRKRGLKLHRANDSQGKVIQNEYGEPLWVVDIIEGD